jgi:hypothetical protein
MKSANSDFFAPHEFLNTVLHQEEMEIWTMRMERLDLDFTSFVQSVWFAPVLYL